MALGRRAFVAAAGFAAAPARAQAPWPGKPLSMIVPFGVGRGSDQLARIVAILLERELRQPVEIANRIGGGGVAGHAALAAAAPDGYTIGVVTAEIGLLHWQGQTELTGASFAPLALMNAEPAGLHVAAAAPWRDLRQLLAAIAESPGKYKASGGPHAGVWHLALAGWLKASGLAPDAVRWTPSPGSAQAMFELGRGVDLAICSMPEARARVEAGKARSLAIMAEKRHPHFQGVPSVEEEHGVAWRFASWRGVAAPAGLAADATARLGPALRKAYDSKEFAAYMAERGYLAVWGDGASLARHMDEHDRRFYAMLKAFGLARP